MQVYLTTKYFLDVCMGSLTSCIEHSEGDIFDENTFTFFAGEDFLKFADEKTADESLLIKTANSDDIRDHSYMTSSLPNLRGHPPLLSSSLPVNTRTEGIRSKVVCRRCKYKTPSCAICLSDFELGQKLVIMACGHVYHRVCIKEWFNLNYNCPTCRSNVLGKQD